jgi:hypothetical protein
MIEVHLVRVESARAIGTWHASDVPEEFNHARLSNPDAVQLEASISPVVLDVVRSLASPLGHG